MNHPTIYSDGVKNSIQDSPLRVQNKILGALNNMGATGQSVTAQSGKKANVATITADVDRKNLFIQNTGTADLFVKLGTVDGASDYHFEVANNNGLAGTGGTLNVDSYTGVISIHPSTNSFALVEFK